MNRNPTKWVFVSVLAGVAFARDGSSSQPAVRDPGTEAATAIPTAEECPASQEVCDFALRIADAVVRASFAELRALMQPWEFTCPEPLKPGPGGPYPLCNQASPGERRMGYRIHRLNSDGGTVVAQPLTEIRNSVLDGGQFLDNLAGGPQPRIIGVQCPITGSFANCDNHFVVYFRGSVHFVVDRLEGKLAVTSLQFGDFAEGSSVFDRGGQFAMVRGDGVVDGKFLPWRPAGPAAESAQVKERWLLAPPEITGVIVRPAAGPCLANLTVEVPEAATTPNPKGSEVAEVWLFSGPVGVNQGATDRTLRHQVVGPEQRPGTHEFQFGLDPSMASGTICHGSSLSLLVWGVGGPRVAGYRIIPP